jgi:ATP-binding cassette subfamily C protein
MTSDEMAGEGLVATIRRCSALISGGQRTRWLIVLAVAVGVGLLEVLAALLVLFLLRLVTTPEQGPVLPLVGDLRERFPGVGETPLFLGITVALAVFFLFRGACALGQTYLQNKVAQEAGVVLSERLAEKYLRMEYEAHQQRNSAELIRNAYTSVDQIVAHAFVPLVGVASESLVVCGVVAVLLTTAPSATLLAGLLLGPLVLLLIRTVQPRLGRLGEQGQQASRSTLQILTQSFEGIREIIVSGRRHYFLQRFVTERRKLARSQYRRAVLVDAPRLTVEAGAMLFILGFLAVGTATGGAERSLPILGLFAYAVLRLMPALNRIVSSLNVLRFSGAAVRHVHHDLLGAVGSAGGSLDAVSGERDKLPFEREILFDGVGYRYPAGDRDVLHDVTLSIQRGSSVGVVGHTGGGKSTLVDVLLGLLAPTRGRLLVDGVDVQDDTAAWQARLGVVPQTIFLLDDTLRRNIAFGVDDAEIDEQAVHEAAELAQLGDVLTASPEGLDTVVGERGVRLSGGQRQRVAIARALYERPDVLVLDEGTSALDTVTEAEMMRALERLRGQRTVIMVAHRLSTVRACDRILLLENGAVADEGTYDELRSRSAAFRLMTGS